MTFDYSTFLRSCLIESESRKSVKAPPYNDFKTPISQENVDAKSTTTRPPCYGCATEAIGKTPMFRLHRMEKRYGLKCELYAKAEFMSVGGSVKDRISLGMIERAEKNGQISPGDIVLEATSGNTGIGLALVCAARGYQLVVTMPEKMSSEKENVLKLLGAKVIRTRTSAVWHDEDSHVVLAYRMAEEINSRTENTGIRALVCDQYQNSGNISTHYHTTGEEILAQLDNKLDVFVAGAGTGGTVSGIAYKLKEKLPELEIIGVDPKGSRLHIDPENWTGNELSPYEIEGVGYDFVPPVCHRNVIKRWEVVDDSEAFNTARELIQEEALLVGGSSGLAMCAGLRVAKTLAKGQRVVVLLPDSIRNYLSKFAEVNWMYFHGFMDIENQCCSDTGSVKSVLESSRMRLRKLKDLPQISSDTLVQDCFKAVTKSPHMMIEGDKQIAGVLLAEDLTPTLVEDDGNLNKPIRDVIALKSFACVTPDTSISALRAVLKMCRKGTKNGQTLLIIVPSENKGSLNQTQLRKELIEMPFEVAMNCEFLDIPEQLELLSCTW